MTSYLVFEDLKHIPCYVINLDGQESKWLITKQRLQDLGFSNINRYSAVDGKLTNPTIELQKKYDVNWFENFKNKSEQACALSHLNLLSEMTQKNEEYRLIFEDDIIIHSDFHEKFKQLKIIKNSFDVLFLGGWFWSKQYNDICVKDLSKALDKELQRTCIRNAVSYEAHAYLVNSRFAQECITKFKHWRGHRQAVDNFYTEDNTLDIRKCLLTHSPAESSNLDEIRTRDGNICGLIYQTHQYISNIQPKQYIETTIEDLPVQWIQYSNNTSDVYNNFKLYSSPSPIHSFDVALKDRGLLIIKNGIISNGGLLFSENGEKLHADVSWVGKKENRSELQRKVFWMHQYDRIDDIVYHEGVALNLYNIWSNINAHHAIAETASKLSLIEQYSPNILNEADWFIIPQNNFVLYKQLLTLYNIPENKCLNVNYKHSWGFSKVITPVDHGCFYKDVFKNTQKRFNICYNENSTQRVFLTRSSCGRDVYNINELTTYLEKNNFVSVDAAQNYNIPQILSNAEIVIAAHGAALTNLIFCRPGTIVIELIPEFFRSDIYANICYSNNLQYNGIVCKDSAIIKTISHNTPFSEKSFIVDTSLIDDILYQHKNKEVVSTIELAVTETLDFNTLDEPHNVESSNIPINPHESINSVLMDSILKESPRTRPDIIINAPKIVTSYLIRPS